MKKRGSVVVPYESKVSMHTATPRLSEGFIGWCASVLLIPTKEDTPMEPTNPYGATKMSAENWFRVYKDNYDLDYIVLRYFNVYGPRQRAGSPYAGVIANWAHSLLMQKPLVVYGNGKQTRDFIHVQDVVSCFINFIKKSNTVEFRSNEIINVCTGHETSVDEITNLMIKSFYSQKNIKCSKFTEGHTPGDMYRSFGNPSKIRSDFNFSTTLNVEEGISDMVAWASEVIK